MTSGTGLLYLNIAVAESADRLACSFDFTLCKHCVRFKRGHLRSCRSTSTHPICHCSPHQNVRCYVLRWPLCTVQLQVHAKVRVANSLQVCKNASRLLPSILAILCQYSTPINTGRVESSCSRADKLAALVLVEWFVASFFRLIYI